jgi:hypothetical protein
MARTVDYALQIRVSREMALQWKKDAARSGVSLSEWVRANVEEMRVVNAVASVARPKGPTRRGKIRSTPVAVRTVRGTSPRGAAKSGHGDGGGDSGRLPAKG